MDIEPNATRNFNYHAAAQEWIRSLPPHAPMLDQFAVAAFIAGCRNMQGRLDSLCEEACRLNPEASDAYRQIALTPC